MTRHAEELSTKDQDLKDLQSLSDAQLVISKLQSQADGPAGGESAGAAMLTVMHKGIRYQLQLPVGAADGEAFFVELGAADDSPAEITVRKSGDL